MKFYKLQRGYWQAEGEGGSAGGSPGVNSDDPKDEGSEGDADNGDTSDNGSDRDNPKDKKPTDQEAKLLKEVMAKKSRVKELESTLNDTQERLKQFEGIDPDQVRALMKEREEAEKSKLEEKGEWEALKKRMAEEHQSAQDKLQNELAEAQKALQQKSALIEELTLGHEFDNSEFIRSELYLTPRKTRAVYGSHFEVDENGRVVGYDKPANAGNRTALVDASGEPLPFDEAVKRLVESDPDKDSLLRDKRRAGAASKTDATRGVGSGRKLSSREKIERGLKQIG